MSQSEEEALIEFLAIVYRRVDWRKMHTRVSPHDIFNHRVRAASRRGTIYAFATKLCNYFGLQTLPAESIEPLSVLQRNETEVLNVIYTEHIPFCVRAIMRAKGGSKND